MSEDSPGLRRRIDWQAVLCGSILAIAAVAAYCRTFFVPFLYDDGDSITNNASIRHLATAFFPPANASVSGRPFLNLSLALNYAIGGTAVWGYHAANLGIHVLAGLTLFGIVRRTLARRSGQTPSVVAFCCALLWILHPLSTEAVTYAIQRAESLMGLLYLQTIYWFVRWVDVSRTDPASPAGAGRASFAALSVLSCACGMATKEVMVSAPLAVLLLDRLLFSSSFGEAWRRRKGYYLAIAATWIPLGLLVWHTGNRGGTSGFGSRVSALRYWSTQPEAIVRYLKLAVWPHPLVFDYGTEWIAQVGRPAGESVILFRVVLPAAFVAGLVAVTCHGLVRNRLHGLLGFLFFAVLATTSLIPGNHQTAAEHRMYLALIAVVLPVTLGIFRWAPSAALPVCVVLASFLGVATFARNLDYSSELRIWRDTVARKPANFVAHLNLGNAWLAFPGGSREAIAEYGESIRLNPDYVIAHNNLGCLLATMPGRLEDAISQYEEALRLNPAYADAHYNLGNAFDALGRTPDAVAQFEEAVALKPDLVEARANLGLDLSFLGRSTEAITQYREALRERPGDPALLYDLAFELLKDPGGAAEADADLREVLRLQPGNKAARQALERVNR